MCTENLSLVVRCVLQSKSAKSTAQVSNGQIRKGVVRIVTGYYSRLKAWLELEKNNDFLEIDLTSWQQTYSWIGYGMWSPAEEDLPCWRPNRAEHISARHHQLAFLSRSDPPPPPPPKCLQNVPVVDSE